MLVTSRQVRVPQEWARRESKCFGWKRCDGGESSSDVEEDDEEEDCAAAPTGGCRAKVRARCS
jgi:hypothetical protein